MICTCTTDNKMHVRLRC